MIRSIALLALLAFTTSAAAVEVAIGNLAPGTVDRNPVSVLVDGDRVERNLVYRRFVRVDLAPGEHVVAFLAASNDDPLGVVLAERRVTIALRNGTTPTIVLAGNGSTQPFVIELFDGAAQPATAAARPSISLHHLAPFANAQSPANALIAGATCRNNAAQGGTQTQEVLYRGEAVLDPGTAPRLACTASFVLAGVGGIELASVLLPQAGVLRAFLIGDAVNAPFEIIAVSGAEVLGTSSGSAVNPSAILRSPTFWFDADRPTEGVSLFEETARNGAYATWFTFGADGHPAWYALIGGTGANALRRDFTVFEPRRGGGAQSLVQVGSAVLQYFDCNSAELRIVLGGSDLRTLRLRRSRPVEVCIALDRGH